VGALTPVFFRRPYSIALREGGWANIGTLGLLLDLYKKRLQWRSFSFTQRTLCRPFMTRQTLPE
jgi:hypothetical protein